MTATGGLGAQTVYDRSLSCVLPAIMVGHAPGRILRGSGSTRAPENGRNGSQQNFKIQPQRPFIDVLQVQLHPFLERDRTSAPNLPQACYSWPHAEATA